MAETSGVPAVSVVVAYRDADRFLDEAILSVHAQSVTDWELLLVDDGSTDGSAAIARAHALRHPGRVRCLAHGAGRNLGISASRNLGIRHARADLIAFLDADDCWFPDRLERQLAILEAFPEVGLIAGASLYWHGGTGREEDRARDRLVRVGAAQDRVAAPPSLLTTLYPLGRGDAPSMSGLLVRRQAVERAGGFEDRFRGMYEDQAFLTKIYLDTPVYVSGACFDRYRQHEGSCLATAHAEGQYARARHGFLDWFADHLRQRGVFDPRLWWALERARLPYRHPVAARIARMIWRRFRPRGSGSQKC